MNEDTLYNTEEEAEEIEESFEEYSDTEIVEEDPEETFDIPHARKIIEAVLFAAGYPVSYERLAKVCETTSGAIKKIVKDYAEEYNAEDCPIQRGIMLAVFDRSCQLCTKEQYGTYIREALGIKKGGNLSQSSIETLAIIAYNEPVTRAFVDTVRGVDSSYAVASLLEKQLIETCGRLEVPGRPRLFRTTENFLRVFGLTSLEELPEVNVVTAGIQEKIVIPEDDNETAVDNEETVENETDDKQN